MFDLAEHSSHFSLIWLCLRKGEPPLSPTRSGPSIRPSTHGARLGDRGWGREGRHVLALLAVINTSRAKMTSLHGALTVKLTSRLGRPSLAALLTKHDGALSPGLQPKHGLGGGGESTERGCLILCHPDVGPQETRQLPRQTWDPVCPHHAQ